MGGELWRVRLARGDLLNDDKFAAYVCVQGDGDPEMRVEVDERLIGEAGRAPAVRLRDGKIEFEAQETRWSGDCALARVEALVAPSTLALERALTGWICSRLVRTGALMLHAAAVRSANGAWLLLGRSGGGKSTASVLAGQRRLCTNCVIVRHEAGRWLVYTTPFTGNQDPYPCEAGPFQLAGAMVLEKAEAAHSPVPVFAAGARLAALAQAVVAQYPRTAETASAVLGALDSVVAECPVARLPFARDAIVLPE